MKNQLDAQLILSLCCLSVRWTTDSYLKRIKSTYCCIHTVAPPDDGPSYVRNM